MIASLVLLFYVLGVVFAVDAIMRVRTPQGAIAWAVALVSFPFVSVPAYAVLGRSKFQGTVEAYETNQSEIDALIDEFRTNLATWSAETHERYESYEAIRTLSGMEMTRANQAELLIDGEDTFDSILEGISQASEYVLVQFYMFHDDDIGREMQQALIERARAGVRVYVLYDEIGSSGLPASYLEALRHGGVEVSAFRPTQGHGNRFQVNFRNHRKIVVVDGTVGWVGGHNVGDEYLGRDPDFSPWRDTHVRLAGPMVTQLQAVVVGDWFWATRELPQLNWQPQAVEDGGMVGMIIPSAPNQRLETAGLLFVTALNSAKRRVWLSAPYFVPDEAVMKALELAALRGLDVRIITTGKPDSLPVYLAAFHYMDQLRDLGIRFYAYAPGFLHQKAMLIDDDVAMVGTANFDNRSFRLNFEVTAVIADRAFASQTAAMFEQDFGHAELLEPALDGKSFWFRLGVNLSRLAAPVL